METNENKPEKTIRVGNVVATIWKNTTDDKTYYSINIVKNYKDKKDQWKETSNYGIHELPKVQIASNKALEYVYFESKEDSK